jgi:hypothetical protein
MASELVNAGRLHLRLDLYVFLFVCFVIPPIEVVLGGLATPVPTRVSASTRDYDLPDDRHISPRPSCFLSPADITRSKKLITGGLDQSSFDFYSKMSGGELDGM